MSAMQRHSWPAWLLNPATGLAALLIAAGVMHFVTPAFFDKIVPESLPGSQRLWTLISGAAELGVGATVIVPRSRRVGATLAGLLFLAVWPANFKMAFDWGDRSAGERALAYGRLPLQLPLIYLAWIVRRSTRPVSRA